MKPAPIRPAAPWLPLSLLLTFLLAATPVGAQGIERLESYRDWTAFKSVEGGNPVCYMGSRPIRDEGNYTQRGEIAFLVTHRPAEGRVGEVSYRAGYTYQDNSVVNVNIDGQIYQLLTQGGVAWPANSETDQVLITAMRGGATAIVQGTSSRGTLTTDTYSLQGFTAAYRAISEACGL